MGCRDCAANGTVHCQDCRTNQGVCPYSQRADHTCKARGHGAIRCAGTDCPEGD